MRNKRKILVFILLAMFVGVFSINVKADSRSTEEFLQELINLVNEDPVKALEKYKEYEESDEVKESKEKELQLYFAMGQVYNMKADFENTVKYMKKTEELLIEAQEYFDLISVYRSLSSLYLSVKEYDEAIVYGYNLQELAEYFYNDKKSSGNEKNYYSEILYTVYLDMATICNEIKIMDKAKYYLKEAEKLMIKDNIPPKEELYYNGCKYYYNTKDYEKALESALEAYEFKKKMDEANGTDYKNMALLYVGKSRTELGQLDQAEKDLDNALELYRRVGDGISESKALLSKGIIEKKRKNYKKAIEYCEEALQIQQDLKLNRLIWDSSRELVELCELIGDKVKLEKYSKVSLDISKEIEVVNESNEIYKMLSNLQEDKYIKEKEEAERISKLKIGIIVSILIVVILVTINLSTVIRYNKKEIMLKNEEKEKLEKALITDGLTKAFTRPYAVNVMEKLIENKESFSIAMLDVDDYKKINDTYGHRFGDIVLIDLVKCMKENLTDNEILSRYGGEEFIILFKGVGVLEAEKACEKIRSSINDIEWQENIKVTVSIGVAEFVDGNLEDTIVKADKLLYKAKETGKNKVVVQ